MKKLILIIGAVLSLFSLLAHAEIQVQVQPSQINLGGTFQLILTQEDPQNGGVPDLSVLQRDFVILGTERQINYSIINGQTQSVNQWIVALKPLKSGILTIPVIKFGLDQSMPITINVDASTKSQEVQLDADTQQDVALAAGVDEQKPYVNQQIIYTVKLYNSKRLLDARYQGPQVEDALLVPLGDANRYQTVQNNTNYIVEEQKYAIFPQKSGNLKIKSPIFTAMVYDFNSQPIRVQDKTLNLSIKPIPKQFKGKTWLPAQQIKLTESYENANQTINQGSTLTRTITIQGVAVPAQLLPSLNFSDTDAFNVYPEKGKDNNQVQQGQLVGSTEIKVTYLFNKAGKVTIPEVQLPWFNTETGKEEVALLPPRSMEITPSAAASSTTSQQQTVSNDGATTQPVQPIAESSVQAKNNWGWIIAIVFASAWIITLVLWGWQKRSIHLGRGQYKNALDELKKACTECNPIKARDALLQWASLHWPDAPLLNLTDLTKLVRDVHLKKQLHLLSQVLYKSDEKILWRGDELLRSVYALKRSTPGKQRKTNALPPINPY